MPRTCTVYVNGQPSKTFPRKIDAYEHACTISHDYLDRGWYYNENASEAEPHKGRFYFAVFTKGTKDTTVSVWAD